MDKFAQRLRDDATTIQPEISPELDYRLRASLSGVTQDRPEDAVVKRPAIFWWASSLTGLAAALAVVAILNATDSPEVIAPVATINPPADRSLPRLPLRAEVAMITSPLQKELDNLAADLRKARDEVATDVESVLPTEQRDPPQ
jgi:hypothetical protein